ncbi:hypothetical protein M9Y10_012119 [Tritrichomonas musculus]|uniref:AAA-ATPase-like domain-containing protein n=1 Tax=Tritrichomonas musculus TaxID=1915356 RepID=A0ABR2IBN3_9EUKA
MNNVNVNNDAKPNTIHTAEASNIPKQIVQANATIQTPKENLSSVKKPSQPKHLNINFSANLLQIKKENLVFFDKSEDLNKLFSLGLNRILILRPPLFGKTIICDMIEALFTGNQSLLQSLNCKIINSWDFSKTYTVIRFSMRFYATNFDEFYIHFTNIVANLFTQFHISNDVFKHFGIPQDALAYLIQSFTNNGQKVVLIIEDIESCLIHIPYGDPNIQKIKLCMQQLFNYISNIKDSIEFLLIMGIDNFYDLSNICIDLTESPDIAGLFGITLKDINQINFFMPEDSNENNYNNFQYKKTVGSFQKSIKDTFMYLKDEFIKSLAYINQSNQKGFIQLKYLQSILLNSGGTCFSPKSDITVSNYVDFLGMCYNGKAEHFWLEMIIKRETDSLSKDIINLFKCYSNNTKIYDDIIINELYNDIHNLSPLFDNYRYLIRFGFFTFRGEKIYPTNFGILTLLFSSAIEYFKISANLDLHSWANFSFKDIMIPSFTNFYKTARIPAVLKAKKCIETIIAIFLSSIYQNSQKMLMKDGSFIIYSTLIIFKFVEITDFDNCFNCFNCKETVYLIHIQSTPEKGESVTFYFKFGNKHNCFSIDIPPYYDSNLSISNEPSPRNGIFSFVDVVLNILFHSCWGKPDGIDKFFIAAELMKKMPELSGDKTLDKKICLALQLLCQNGKVKFYTDPKSKSILYTLVKNIVPITQTQS